MMDTSLPLTVGEYLEWGNPNDKAAAYRYMLHTARTTTSNASHIRRSWQTT